MADRRGRIDQVVGIVRIGVRGISVRRLIVAIVGVFVVVPTLITLFSDVAPGSIPVIGGTFLLILSLLEAAAWMFIATGLVVWAGIGILLIYGMQKNKLDDWEWFPFNGLEEAARPKSKSQKGGKQRSIDLPSASLEDAQKAFKRTKSGVKSARRMVEKAREKAEATPSSANNQQPKTRSDEDTQHDQ
jgi:hypothetical protein